MVGMLWHTRTLETVYEDLHTSADGLSETEAIQRLKRYGPNQLAIKKDPWWAVIIEPFRSIFIAILLLAAFISLLNHESLDTAIILTIIVINAVIFYVQHFATNRVLRSLKRHNIQQVSVLRNGKLTSVSSLDIVPGDVIKLDEGERIPADARLIHMENLQINESSLTGESLPIHKTVSVLSEDKPIYERHNMVFQGTYVLGGTGLAVVVDTGAHTEFGAIAALASQKPEKSPVQKKIDDIVGLLIKVLSGLALVVFMLSLSRGISATEALRFVLSMSVSAVPEGLPVALTVIIVLGMRRMAQQKVLMRSFKSIEDIGLITVIATDKTGTLTKNNIKVTEQWSPNGDDIKPLVAKTSGPGNSSKDPLDIALFEYAGSHKTGFTQVYPFDSSLRMSGAYYQDEHTVFIKGSPEHILSQSKVSADVRTKAESMMHTYASQGFRVIAIAKHKTTHAPADLKPLQKAALEFVGLVACADELRPEAGQALQKVADAGIQVKLITGDHFETAYNIGKKLGLVTQSDQVITGADLPKNPDELAAVVQQKTIFARIVPEDKFNLLRALQKTDITAMTGDGVNDVPALANANVGIAMGSGSDIAKDASDIVLLNDNFATIVEALSEGRRIFDNIRRMLYYILSTSLGEVLTMIGALAIGLPLPVTAVQILWINLVTDTAMVLPLGLEPHEKGHMQRPPRNPKDPLLSKTMLFRMGLVAVTMAAISLVLLTILHGRNYSTAYIQTVVFMSLIAAQWANAFNARSETESILTRIKQKNYGMVVGLTVAVVLQMLVMFGPLANAFNIQPVAPGILLGCVFASITSVLVVAETHKWIVRRFKNS